MIAKLNGKKMRERIDGKGIIMTLFDSTLYSGTPGGPDPL